MNRTWNRLFCPAFDALDARQLMAAHVTAALAHGVLTVKGTGTADVIDVQVDHGQVEVAGVARRFAAGRIKRIDVTGGKGNDTIVVQTPSIPVRIDGGSGNDTINGVPDTPTAAAAVATRAPQVQLVLASPQPAAAVTTTPVAPVASAPDSAATVQQIISLTNAQRVAAGLAPLAVNASLMQAATVQSSNMAQLDTMSHSLPGTNAPELTDRAALVGYHYTLLGENIAFNYADADAVVAGWMASPEHRANILNPGYTQIGVAVAYNAAGEPYYTQEFGTPA